MTATLTTTVIRDAGGTEYAMRALEVSGAGTGPFAVMYGLLGSAGAGIEASDPVPTVSVADPGRKARKLVAADLSDSVDLAIPARAFRVSNQSTAKVVLLVTPADEASDTAATPITISPSSTGWEALSIRRVWSTGSTDLAAGLAAGTVEVVLITD